jgi:hypothetical protein
MKSLLIVCLVTMAAFTVNAESVILDGTYEVLMQIGDTLYHDEMVLQGASGPINPVDFYGDLKGQITVPNAFTAPLIGNGFCTPWVGHCNFKFEIVAHEGNQDYKVFYEAQIKPRDYGKIVRGEMNPQMSGTAKLENGEVLGTFTAIKKP